MHGFSMMTSRQSASPIGGEGNSQTRHGFIVVEWIIYYPYCNTTRNSHCFRERLAIFQISRLMFSWDKSFHIINSMKPGVVYKCRWTGPSLAQEMGFFTCSVQNHDLNQYWLVVSDHREQILKWYMKFYIHKMYLQRSSATCQPFRLDLHV